LGDEEQEAKTPEVDVERGFRAVCENFELFGVNGFQNP
jgi:hypothetical protein